MQVLLDKLEALPSIDWHLEDLDSLDDWTDELKGISSSSVSKLRRIMSECSTRIDRVFQARLESELEITPPTPSARARNLPSASSSKSQAPATVQLKEGTVYTNPQKVCVGKIPFELCFILTFFDSVTFAYHEIRSASRLLVLLGVFLAPKPVRHAR
jgi:hypothetical protein